MSQSLRNQLDNVPVRNLKAELQRRDSDLQKLKPHAGQVLKQAVDRADLEPKAIATDLNLSHSLVLRAFKESDEQSSISFHKLWELDDEFWRELLIVVAKARGLAQPRIQLDFYQPYAGPDRRRA